MLEARNQIIVADKFGDVYALPAFPTDEEDEAARLAARTSTRLYRPTASESTVHSAANLRALQFQKKLAEEGKDPDIKNSDVLAFAHQLVVGHVSMINDVVIAQSSTGPRGLRNFIVTCDRDEHIRVSRAPPQAFVIESNLLAHREFVSTLCLVDTRTLVSGGGDDELYVWDWEQARKTGCVPLRQACDRVERSQTGKIAVSRLVPHQVADDRVCCFPHGILCVAFTV